MCVWNKKSIHKTADLLRLADLMRTDPGVYTEQCKEVKAPSEWEL